MKFLINFFSFSFVTFLSLPFFRLRPRRCFPQSSAAIRILSLHSILLPLPRRGEQMVLGTSFGLNNRLHRQVVSFGSKIFKGPWPRPKMFIFLKYGVCLCHSCGSCLGLLSLQAQHLHPSCPPSGGGWYSPSLLGPASLESFLCSDHLSCQTPFVPLLPGWLLFTFYFNPKHLNVLQCQGV